MNITRIKSAEKVGMEIDKKSLERRNSFEKVNDELEFEIGKGRAGQNTY